jgi:glycosyltransferase involved in cell wall biosynthesis
LDILHINNFYNPGGSAKACYEIAFNLQEHNQSFVGFADGQTRYDFMNLGHAHLFKTIAPFDYGQRVIDLISYFKPDIIHVYIPGHENPSYFNDIPLDIPKVCTVLCGQSIGFDPIIFDKITFLSDYSLNLNKNKCLNNKCLVVRGGMSPALIEEKEKKKTLDNRNPVFGRVSAMCPSKKIEDTLYCAERMPENKFLIGGEVQDKNYCRELVRRAERLSNVEFYVNITQKLKNSIYERSDIIHYPTSNETFCFSILEGMERGRAVISYNNSAIKELSNKDNLVLAEDEDLDKLLSLTRRMASDSGYIKNIGKLNKEVYEEFYTSQRYADDILSIYMEAIDVKKN